MVRLATLILSFLLFVPQAKAISTSAYRVLTLINIEREERRLPRLSMDAKLAKAAYAHAVDMSRRGYFSHTSPDGVGMTTRLRRAGATYTAAAENIARGHTSAVSVVSGWMNSSGHRKNILSRKYRKIGIARYNNYWVQNFSN